jgi:hypothetical protein
MSAPFDPYHAWLGILPHEQPADFYRLLGLPRFEANPARIAAAADERLRLVSAYQTGPWGAQARQIVSELSAAKTCLLSPASKVSYDAALSQQPVGRPAQAPSYRPAGYPPQAAWRTPMQHMQPAAPQPPSAPQSARSAVPPDEMDEEFEEVVNSAGWWRTAAIVLAMFLVLIAVATSWGIWRVLNRPPAEVPLAGPATDPEARPADLAAEPPPDPNLMLQEGSGVVNFLNSTAALSGSVEMRLAGTDEVLANWTGTEDAAQWDFRLVRPGFFQIELVYATAQDAGGFELEASVGSQAKRCELRATGGLDKFLTDNYTIALPVSGRHTLALRPGRKPAGDWLVLRSVRLIPVAANVVPPASGP